MIELALKQYLTHPRNVTGHAAEPFAAPQVIEGRTLLNRNDARRHVQDMIGDRVYQGRIPQTVKDHTAVKVSHIAGSRSLALRGETGMISSVLEISVLSRAGAQADHIAALAARLIEVAVVNYYGFWGDIWIHGVSSERPVSQRIKGLAADDVWPVEWSTDVSVWYTAAGAVYPNRSLVSRIKTSDGPAGAVVFSGRGSDVPEGRTMTSVVWTVRDYQGGPVVKTWSGNPDAVSGEVDVDGQNIEAAVSGISSSGWVELLVTDSFGTQAMAGQSYDH